MPAPVSAPSIIACPESGIVGQTVVFKTAHPLCQLIVFYLQRIRIDTFLSTEVDDVVLGGVTIQDFHTTLEPPVIFIHTTVTTTIVGVLGHAKAVLCHFGSRRFLRYEVKVIILCRHGLRKGYNQHGKQ